MLDSGDSMVAFAEIVGPDKHIQSMQSVAGESDENLTVTVGTREIKVTTEDGRELSYSF